MNQKEKWQKNENFTGKPKTVFDHLSVIYENQNINYWDNLSSSDKKTYNSYLINRFISMNRDYVEVVNEIQKYPIENRESYLFYSQILPKGRQFNKYIKAAKADSYEKWALELVSKYFQVSLREAYTYMEIFYMSKEGKEELREICENYGINPKEIKKLKI